MYQDSFYRPPNRKTPRLKELNKSITSLPHQAEAKTIALAGDFNAPDIDWETTSLRPENATT